VRHLSSKGISALGPENFGLPADGVYVLVCGKPLTCGAKKIPGLKKKNKINEGNASLLPQTALKPTHNTKEALGTSTLSLPLSTVLSLHLFETSTVDIFQNVHWVSVQPPTQRG